MAAGSYERKEFVGGAPTTELTGTIDAIQTTFSIDNATGWPTADTYPFVIAVDYGQASEEKMLVSARTGTTLTIATRGYDDTSGQAHSSGALCVHVMDASTLDQANRLANLLTSKGDVFASNGTNPTRIAGTAQVDASQDGYSLIVKNSEATGLSFARPVAVEVEAAEPGVAAVPRLWYSETYHCLFTSDGTTWLPDSSFPQVANTAARDVLFGGAPTQPGIGCMVGTQLQIWSGTAWVPIPKIDEAIGKFANAAARDAYFTSPATGDHAYLVDVHQLTEYRQDEWILINRKFTTSDTAPASPHDGDIWIQPS